MVTNKYQFCFKTFLSMITPFRKYASETNQSVTAPSFESHIMVAGFPHTLLRLMSTLKQTIPQNQIDVRWAVCFAHWDCIWPARLSLISDSEWRSHPLVSFMPFSTKPQVLSPAPPSSLPIPPPFSSLPPHKQDRIHSVSDAMHSDQRDAWASTNIQAASLQNNLRCSP